MTEKASHENPLVPNAKLRQMYVAMVEMRLLDEYIRGLRQGKKPRLALHSTQGEEACRVSTAIGLEESDLVSDGGAGAAMELLLGARPKEVLRQLSKEISKTKTALKNNASGRLLPVIENANDRIRSAVGVALAFKTLKRPNMVVAYLRHGEIAASDWRGVLELASKLELPILFVTLPERAGKKRERTSKLNAKARSFGVPNIPVDATDAVALYRVAQESIGRMRNGGGPVVIECVAYRMRDSAKHATADAVTQLRQFLLGRGICKETWLDKAGTALRQRIASI